MDISEPSTHLSRDRGSRDTALEDLLTGWGEDRARMLSALSTGSSSPIAEVIDKVMSSGPKQTRSVQPKTPQYWVHYRTSRINKAVHDLHQAYQHILILRYEYGWQASDFVKQYRWSHKQYSDMAYKARKAIKSHPEIKQMLGRY